STGGYLDYVTLTEVDPQGAEDRWSTGIQSWPIKSDDGRDVGVFSQSVSDWGWLREIGSAVPITSWVPSHDNQAIAGPSVPLSWDRDWFVAGAHASPAGVLVVSRYGPRLVDGSHWGAYLKNILKGRQLPPGTRIFSYACRSAVFGQAVADASGHGVTAPTGDIGIDLGLRPRFVQVLLRGGEMPRMVDFVPRDRGVGEAEVRAEDRAYAPYAGRFRAFYKDSSWAELARDYERDLGARLAEDPEVLGAARHMLETLLPEGAQVPVPDGADLTRLMMVALDVAVRDELITVREQTFDEGIDRQQLLHAARGFHLEEVRGNIARGMLDAYRDRVPAARVPMARRAVLAWLLSAGADSLYEALSDTHEVAGASLLERVVLLGDAAHLYAWAQAEFAAGTRLRTPYQALYAARHVWLTSVLTQDGEVPLSPLDSLTDGHIAALRLFAREPDRGVLEAGLEERSGLRVRAGRLEQRVGEAIAGGMVSLPVAGRSAFPLLLARDERFSALIDQALDVPLTAADRYERLALLADAMEARFRELADELLEEIPEHLGMVTEALRSLPPVMSSVWYGMRSAEEGVEAFHIPGFREVTFSEGVVLADLPAHDPGTAGRRVVVEVVNSSARDVSFLSPSPGRATALYPDGGMELNVQDRSWREDVDGNRYEYVQVTEAEPVAQFPVPVGMDLAPEVSGEQGDEATAPVSAEAPLGAEELPGTGWNVPPPADVDESARLPVGVPRYPHFYTDPSWSRMAAEYEIALGIVLGADPEVISGARAAVRALFEHLASAGRYSREIAASAFFRPGAQVTGSHAQEFSRRLADGLADLDALMSMFATAAYHISSRDTLSDIHIPPMRPMLPPDSSQRFHDMRLRGFSLSGDSTGEVERLLGIYREISGSDELLFREALIGWILTSGAVTLVEVLEASHRAGVRDESEPDLSDASQLYGWVHGVLNPRARMTRPNRLGLLATSATLRSRLTPPHHRMYSERMRWIDISNLTRREGETAGDASGALGRELALRRELLRDWVLRHGSVHLINKNMNDAYLRALHLVSGSDARLFDAMSKDDGTRESRSRLRGTLSSLVAGESGSSERSFTVPLMFLRDENTLRSLRHEELVSRAVELVESHRGEMPAHRSMAAEALEMFPPFPGRVWWTTKAVRRPSVGAEFGLPQFHRVSTDMPTALNAPLGGQGALNVVWSVDRSSARDISPWARVAGERVALYPAETRFQVVSVSRGRRYDDDSRRDFVHVTLTEVVPGRSERQWNPEILTVPARNGDGRDLGVMITDAPGRRDLRNALSNLAHVTHGGGFLAMVHAGPHGVEVVSRYGPRLVGGSHWGAYLGNLLADRGLPADTRIYAVERQPAALGQAVADASGHGVTVPLRMDGVAGLTPRLLVVDFEPRNRPVTDVTLREAHPAHIPHAERFRHIVQLPRWSEQAREYERGLGEVLADDPAVLGAARHMLGTLMFDGMSEQGLDVEDIDFEDFDLTRLMTLVTLAAVGDGLVSARRLRDGASPHTQALNARGFHLASDRSHLGRDLLAAYGERVPAERLPLARRAVLGWLLSTEQDSLYEALSDTHEVAGAPVLEQAVLLGDAVQLYAWAHAEFAVGTRLLTPYQARYEERYARLAAQASALARAAFGPRALPSSRADEPAPARRRRDAVRDWLRRVPGRLSTRSRRSGTPEPENTIVRPEVLRDVIRPHGVTSSPLDSLTDGHLTALYLFSLDPDRGLLTAGLVERSGIGEVARNILQRRSLRTAVTASIRQAVPTLPAGGRSGFPLLLASEERFGELIDRAGVVVPLTEPHRGEWLAAVEADLGRHVDEMGGTLLHDIFEHVGMAAEALRSLPPMNASMWLTHQTPHADMNSFRIPAFSKGALNRREAIASLPEQGGDSTGHRLLVEVVNSSARDVSFLSPTPGRTIAMYADRGMELIAQHRSWPKDADGNRYEYVKVTEAEPVGPFPVPVRTLDVVGADELPGAAHWNAPAPADVAEPAQSPGGVSRYPLFYNDPSWAGRTAEYETGLGKVLAADPGVIRGARDAVRALHEYLAGLGRDRPADVASASFEPENLPFPSPSEELSRLLAEEAGADLRTLMSMFAAVAFRVPSGVALRDWWRGGSPVTMPPMEPETEPHSRRLLEEMGSRGFRLTEGPAGQVERLFGLFREVRGGDELLFREALLGWLLPSGEQSLVEVL
ncbi:hypothetical protein, partial [Streptomyces sp. NPDC060022]|uniref:hypothetical protein n=1 Tax=Streptomyces sp. NPDC060022 TaxID=3347039 RepID=UPI00367F6B92